MDLDDDDDVMMRELEDHMKSATLAVSFLQFNYNMSTCMHVLYYLYG